MVNRKGYTFYFLAVLVLVGIISVILATKLGTGISPDSVHYISAARNLLDGHGLSILSGLLYDNEGVRPITHYPPLYPTLLAMIGFFGIDLLDGARWLNAFLFGANILLVGAIIKYYSRSFLISILGSFLILASIDMLSIHSWAGSEPAFIFFSLGGLFLLAIYFDNQRPLFLICSSIAIASGFLTRYPGITLVTTGILGIFFFNKKTYYRKIIDSVVFTTITCFPMTLWVIRNLYIAGEATNRKVIYHPITYAHIRRGVSTLSMWLLPERVPPIIRGPFLIGVILVLSGIGIMLLRKIRKQNKSDSIKEYLITLSYLLSLFILVYVLFIIISISFFDAHTILDGRILLPVYVSVIILILCISHKLLCSIEGIHSLKVILIILSIILAGSYIGRGAIWVINSYRDGQGYASKAWKQSEVIQKVRILSPEVRIYTNGPDAIYILTGKHAFMIPNKVNPNTRLINRNYLSQLASIREQIKKQITVLVYFNTIDWRWYLPSEDELKERLSLGIIESRSDGAIYGANE